MTKLAICNNFAILSNRKCLMFLRDEHDIIYLYIPDISVIRSSIFFIRRMEYDKS